MRLHIDPVLKSMDKSQQNVLCKRIVKLLIPSEVLGLRLQ